MEDVILAGFFDKAVKRTKSLPIPILILLTLASSFLILTCATIASAGELDATNQQIGDLQSQGQSLDANYRQALSNLVSVDSQVNRQSAELDAETAKRAQIQASIKAGQQQLQQYQQQLTDRQDALDKRLRSSYKSDDTDYLSVVLGAENFSDFLNRMDAINTIAESDRQLIESFFDAKQKVQGDIDGLAGEQRELDSLISSLGTGQQNLAAARQQQQSVVDSLKSQKQANAGELAQLQSQAAGIEAKMNQIQLQSDSAGGDSGNGDSSSGGTTSGSGGGATAGSGTSITVLATAYCLAGTTATGMPTGMGIIAVDPRVIPLGSRVHVSGYGDAIAADTGGAIIGNRIDVWLPCGQAYEWGSRTVTVTIY